MGINSPLDSSERFRRVQIGAQISDLLGGYGVSFLIAANGAAIPAQTAIARTATARANGTPSISVKPAATPQRSASWSFARLSQRRAAGL